MPKLIYLGSFVDDRKKGLYSSRCGVKTLKKLLDTVKQLGGSEENRKYWIYSPKGKRVNMCFSLERKNFKKLEGLMSV